MNRWKTFMLLALFSSIVVAQAVAQDNSEQQLKQEVIASVDAQADALTDLSDRIWSFAEIAFRESESAEALIEHAAAHGFAIDLQRTGTAESHLSPWP